ncbi:MAG: hypothetical protein O6850_07495 [Acidobacteria bacterium]|nr:hypothetical protein [Acidobacteriota bacterium]
MGPSPGVSSRRADYLVVGRPITASPDPAAAADAVLSEIQKAAEPAQSSPRKK